jgi:hypothetical protein
MIWGRPIQLWSNLVTAAAAAAVAVAAIMGNSIPAAAVAAVVTVVMAFLGLIANSQTVGARSVFGLFKGPQS